jgi:hypothetical protein
LKSSRFFKDLGDREVLQVFAAELDPLDPFTRARTLDALYLCIAGAAWEALRHDRGLSPEDAVGVVRRLVTAVLAG